MVTLTDKYKPKLRESHPLKALVVRPIYQSERKKWDSLMKDYHYLSFRQLVGESLRYVALTKDRWVALLGWASAAYKSMPRDRWIGWSAEQRIKRLPFVINNSRFLVLPGTRVKNLASKTLALNLKRISADWQKAYNHPVALAETFIDHNLFKGTCYKAAGWVALGKTKGFGRNGRRYYRHSSLKTIFIKPIKKEVPKLLSSPFVSPELTGRESLADLNSLDTASLLEKLSCIQDPRDAKGVCHSHTSTLAMGIYARLSGLRTYLKMALWTKTLTQEQLKGFGCRLDENSRRYQPPSEPTIRRMFSLVDNHKLYRAVQQWLGNKEPLPLWVTAAHPVPRGGREL